MLVFNAFHVQARVHGANFMVKSTMERGKQCIMGVLFRLIRNGGAMVRVCGEGIVAIEEG